MNEAGKKRAEQLARKEYSLIEYRNRLVRMQNMDCVCHCSAEVDMGTLLYFSVNDLNLSQGCFVLLVFSEISNPSAEQQEGRDVFGRMFTYAVIEEIAQEVFTGSYSFYSSQLDGRLAMFLNFPFGLLPDPSIVDFIDENCREISRRCRELYDMNVVAYIGEPLDNVQLISTIYSKLLEMATLHRYTSHIFSDSVFRVPLPPAKPLEHRGKTIKDHADTLFALLNDSVELHKTANAILDGFRDEQPNTVDHLKQNLGILFESLCVLARDAGVKLKYDTLRDEQFHILFDSLHWGEPVEWFHYFLEQLRSAYMESVQKAARYQFSRALQYIEENLSDPSLTIEHCAAELGCSTSSLNKAFRTQQNTSAAKYIRDKRLERAWELLREGRSVGDACVQSGFGSIETFHRAFKNRYGITPGQLRGRKDS